MSPLSNTSGARHLASSPCRICSTLPKPWRQSPAPSTTTSSPTRLRARSTTCGHWSTTCCSGGRRRRRRKESVPQPAAAESDVDLAAGDWRGRLLALLDDITSSWAPPSAWEGETSMGTPHTLPAPVLGDMITGELAMHAWDLAVATGQRLQLPADLLTHLHDTVFASVEQGREMGMYGPQVAVPADAPTLDRILGLTGRDPAWA
ncbi:TIGR03086 family metal-binding protein [Actinomadura yumaensis]|uniref:TIGR03086 family metal-binding protein n=1 Tax=Actinomadura yumaensis TaxID=111807 RepID=UPI00360632D2